MDWKAINDIVGAIDSFVWGPAMLVLLVGTGIYLTFKLNFRTWRNLPYSIKSVIGKDARQKKAGGEGDVSSFNALMTALSATIGTGNIVGGHGHVCRRSRGAGVDVALCSVRHHHKVRGMYAGQQIPRSERKGRNEGRPYVHHEERF